jgi:DNA-binding PadR family transcriptional regulator
MAEDVRLNETSYAVLGMIALRDRVTPYELKQMAARSVGNFWTLHQAQLYAEPQRLARAGYVTEERERTGRRRRIYSITEEGRAALREWVARPTAALTELRDAGLLRLFMGADPAALGRAQADAHRARLAEYEQLAELEMPRGPRLALEAGLRHTREWIRFWEELAEGPPAPPPD